MTQEKIPVKSRSEKVQDFCAEHGVSVEFHTKLPSKGCVGAILARNASPELKARGETPKLSQELKTLLFIASDGFVAIHMPGDRALSNMKKTIPVSDHCRHYRDYREHYDFTELSKTLNIPIYRMAHATTGTLNPISIHLDYGKNVRQLFDKSLDPTAEYYTNAGEQTAGIKIVLGLMVKALPNAQWVSITQSHNVDIPSEGKQYQR